jgi:hypothetical protein
MRLIDCDVERHGGVILDIFNEAITNTALVLLSR